MLLGKVFLGVDESDVGWQHDAAKVNFQTKKATQCSKSELPNCICGNRATPPYFSFSFFNLKRTELGGIKYG